MVSNAVNSKKMSIYLIVKWVIKYKRIYQRWKLRYSHDCPWASWGGCRPLVWLDRLIGLSVLSAGERRGLELKSIYVQISSRNETSGDDWRLFELNLVLTRGRLFLIKRKLMYSHDHSGESNNLPAVPPDYRFECTDRVSVTQMFQNQSQHDAETNGISRSTTLDSEDSDDGNGFICPHKVLTPVSWGCI